MEVAKREIIYLSLHCHHQKDSCIKMARTTTWTFTQLLNSEHWFNHGPVYI